MEASYRFFENKDCKYFPCHQGMEGEDFNCLFCYCPMNPYEDCLGTPSYLTNRHGKVIKDCTGCTFPHRPQNYDAIMNFLKKQNQ